MSCGTGYKTILDLRFQDIYVLPIEQVNVALSSDRAAFTSLAEHGVPILHPLPQYCWVNTLEAIGVYLILRQVCQL